MDSELLKSEDVLGLLIIQYTQKIREEARVLPKDSVPAAFFIARRIATGEMLYDKALRQHTSGDVLDVLGTGIRMLRDLLDRSPLDNHEQRLLLRLFRMLLRASADKAAQAEQKLKELPISMREVLRDSGTHAVSMEEYIGAVMFAIEGEGSIDARNWFPGGAEFAEIQRQRSRWGNEPFQYAEAHDLDPMIAFQILKYYTERDELPQEEAFLKLEEFVQKTF